MRKLVITIAFLATLSQSGFAQNRLDSLARKVMELQELRTQTYYTDHRQEVFSKFDSTIYELFTINEFHRQTPIDSAYQYFYDVTDTSEAFPSHPINYNTSTDKRLRIYSWYNYPGGCGHYYTNYLAYEAPSGDFLQFPLDTLDNNPDQSLVRYSQIIEFKYKRKPIYLLLGGGAFCGASSYRNIRLLEYKNGKLAEAFERYPDGKSLFNDGNRGMDLNFTIDVKKRTISYRKYEFDSDIGFYKKDVFEDVSLKFKKGRFIQVQKKR